MGLIEILPFLIASITPLTLGLPLFRLDGRRADEYLCFNIAVMTSSYLIGFIKYAFSGFPVIHVAFLKSSLLGEIYGFIVDPMSVLVGLAVVVAGDLFLIYSIDYMTPGNKFHPVLSGKGRFHAWMLVFVGATLSFLHSSTLLQLLAFFEIMSVACWGLVSYYGTKEALRSAFKALVYTHVGAMIGLYAVVGLCLIEVHDTSLSVLSRMAPTLKLYVFGLTLVAAIAKSAQFPFYSWLPDAMVAPTPASAFLHGAAMIEMGVYLVARVIQFANPLPPLTFEFMLAFLIPTALICMLMYPVQRDAKRLLAYSTIGESMAMYVGLAYAVLGSQYGLQASMLQLFNHAYVKGLAFLVAGVFGYCLGTHSLSNTRGLMRASPLISVGWAASLLGLAGIPPMGVFFGKLFIATSIPSTSSALTYVPLALLLADSCIFFIVGIKWFNELLKGNDSAKHLDVPPLMKLTIVVLLALSVLATLVSLPVMGEISFMGCGIHG